MEDEVYEILKQMKSLSEQIAGMRLQMANSFDIEKINQCEAQIKHKLEILQEMKTENRIIKSGLKKAMNEINEVKRHGAYEEEKSQLHEEFRNVRKEWRTAYYSKIEAQKALIEKHTTVVDLNKKCRRMYDLVNLYKGMTEKQRQEISLESQDDYFIIEKEKLDKMK